MAESAFPFIFIHELWFLTLSYDFREETKPGDSTGPFGFGRTGLNQSESCEIAAQAMLIRVYLFFNMFNVFHIFQSLQYPSISLNIFHVLAILQIIYQVQSWRSVCL